MIESHECPALFSKLERNFSVDIPSDIYPVRKILGRCKDHLGFGDIPRVEIDPAIAARCMGEALLDQVRRVLNQGKLLRIQQAFKEHEGAQETRAHLLSIIFSLVPRYDRSTQIKSAEFRAQELSTFIEQGLFTRNHTDKQFNGNGLTYVSHDALFLLRNKAG